MRLFLSRLVRLLLALALMLSAAPARARAEGTGETVEIRADEFGLPLDASDAARLYAKPSVALKQGGAVSFTVDLPAGGEYTLWFDMASAGAFLSAPEAVLTVDGADPFSAAGKSSRVIFPVFYENAASQFPLDRYGNDALIRQRPLVRWTKVPARDPNFSEPYPLRAPLSAGTHEFRLEVTKESLLLGSVYLEPFRPYPAYAGYLAQNPANDTAGVMISLQAEFPSFKNNTAVRPASQRTLEVTPSDADRQRMNTLGGEAWQASGSAAFYRFDAPADGYYNITLRAVQNTKNNFTVFRRVTINDEVPFAELNAVPFGYSASWRNIPLGGETPYKIFLKKGENTLGIEATNSPYLPAIQNLQKALADINALSLEIRKLTGNQVDPYKEWVIADYIPDIQPRLRAIAGNLRADMQALEAINQTGGSQEVLLYQMAIDNITALAEEPDKIPVRMKRFSEGSGSAAQLLGTALISLQSQPLALDEIYIHSPGTTPTPPAVPFFTSFFYDLRRFANSFGPSPYETIGAAADEVEVWVNRPRQYVDLMQQMADQDFTPRTGIKVKFSIMPNESKLALATAAGIQPDVALGISTNIPYELAIRGALKDLRSFPDFDQMIKIYSPGALLSYIINDSVYAVPETQDFWVTFYRRDILASLGIPVPHTWDEVIEILPELQRYGMNYNTPLSSGQGLKGYLVTAPYLFNYGADLYAPDGFSTGLGSDQAIKAIKFMAEGFTLYGMPITTANFYDSFRYGLLPIGVSNFETYIKLATAAPELNGLWAIDLYPATVLDDGTQLRYATGSAQSCILFKNTDKPDQSWELIKWWMSTETQVDFQQQLILNYGYEYLWNSANVEAFSYSPIPEEHRKVVSEQWQWLQEPVKLPGSYMQERELSNAWNKIVFDGANPRVAIDQAVITINREITRKMEEFGYLQNGVKVKEFKVPTIETVRKWVEDAGQ